MSGDQSVTWISQFSPFCHGSLYSLNCLSSLPLQSLREALSLNLKLTSQLDWLASDGQESSCFPRAGITDTLSLPRLWHGFGARARVLLLLWQRRFQPISPQLHLQLSPFISFLLTSTGDYRSTFLPLDLPLLESSSLSWAVSGLSHQMSCSLDSHMS